MGLFRYMYIYFESPDSAACMIVTLYETLQHCPSSPAALPPPPPTGAGMPSGVLVGQQLSVSTLFSPEDRQVAVAVVRDHGGQWAGLAARVGGGGSPVACVTWCQNPGMWTLKGSRGSITSRTVYRRAGGCSSRQLSHQPSGCGWG